MAQNNPGEPAGFIPRSHTAVEYPQVLTQAEVAELCRVSMDTIRKWQRTGNGFPFLKQGHVVRYPRDRVLAWMAEQAA